MSSKLKPPSRRMIEAARAIDHHVAAFGHSPTLVELGRVLGVSHGRARDIVRDARDRGLVTFEDRRPRTLRVVDHKAIRSRR